MTFRKVNSTRAAKNETKIEYKTCEVLDKSFSESVLVEGNVEDLNWTRDVCGAFRGACGSRRSLSVAGQERGGSGHGVEGLVEVVW